MSNNYIFILAIYICLIYFEWKLIGLSPIIKSLKNRGSPSVCARSAGGGSRELDSERGVGGSGGIVMDVDFVRIGCGVLSSKIIRKKKADFWIF